ncbi:hypothetical protein HOY82DRAFT_610845 [Tuber indicum]|nr:hypothetical protein HOY82DRAFT_610845 [Tuber indicum]
MGGTREATEISLELRCAILTHHIFTDKTWIEISKCLKVHPDSARKICQKAKERASDPTDIQDLYTVLKSLDRPGCPEVIPEGSEMSITLKQAS